MHGLIDSNAGAWYCAAAEQAAQLHVQCALNRIMAALWQPESDAPVSRRVVA